MGVTARTVPGAADPEEGGVHRRVGRVSIWGWMGCSCGRSPTTSPRCGCRSWSSHSGDQGRGLGQSGLLPRLGRSNRRVPGRGHFGRLRDEGGGRTGQRRVSRESRPLSVRTDARTFRRVRPVRTTDPGRNLGLRCRDCLCVSEGKNLLSPSFQTID